MEMLLAVYAGELRVGCQARRDDFPTALAPTRRNDIHDIGTLRTLGMAGWRLMLGKAI